MVRHTQIEKALNRKMRPRYIGPYMVLFRNWGGAYVLCELDGAVLDRPIAAFRVVPFAARKKIAITEEMLDTSENRLKEMHQADDQGEEEPDEEPDDEESGDEDEGQQDQYNANESE